MQTVEYNREKAKEYAKNGHTKEIQATTIMMLLVETVQTLCHNAFFTDVIQ